MAQVVFGLTVDGGDGSSHIQWFRDEAVVRRLLDSDDGVDLEMYGANEGYPSETLTFPDDLDLEACGFRFSDHDE
jgi:hypothetical protein